MADIEISEENTRLCPVCMDDLYVKKGGEGLYCPQHGLVVKVPEEGK